MGAWMVRWTPALSRPPAWSPRLFCPSKKSLRTTYLLHAPESRCLRVPFPGRLRGSAVRAVIGGDLETFLTRLKRMKIRGAFVPGRHECECALEPRQPLDVYPSLPWVRPSVRNSDCPSAIFASQRSFSLAGIAGEANPVLDQLHISGVYRNEASLQCEEAP